MKIDPKTLLLKEMIIQSMQDLKAQDIVCIDLTSIDDAVSKFFVICHGESSVHLQGIVNAIKREVKTELKTSPYSQEGQNHSKWVLMDYIDVVVHVFQKEERDFYDIESVWSKAVKTHIKTD